MCSCYGDLYDEKRKMIRNVLFTCLFGPTLTDVSDLKCLYTLIKEYTNIIYKSFSSHIVFLE